MKVKGYLINGDKFNYEVRLLTEKENNFDGVKLDLSIGLHNYHYTWPIEQAYDFLKQSGGQNSTLIDSFKDNIADVTGIQFNGLELDAMRSNIIDGINDLYYSPEKKEWDFDEKNFKAAYTDSNGKLQLDEFIDSLKVYIKFYHNLVELIFDSIDFIVGPGWLQENKFYCKLDETPALFFYPPECCGDCYWCKYCSECAESKINFMG